MNEVTINVENLFEHKIKYQKPEWLKILKLMFEATNSNTIIIEQRLSKNGMTYRLKGYNDSNYSFEFDEE